MKIMRCSFLAAAFLISITLAIFTPSAMTVQTAPAVALPTLRDFGAIGGGADDTAAIQAALDSRLGIFIPNGEWRFTKDLQLHSDSALIGLGPKSWLRGVNAGLVVTPAPGETLADGWLLQNFKIERTGTAGPCILVLGKGNGSAPVRGVINSIRVDGSTGPGISVRNAYELDIISTNIRRCRGSGLEIIGNGVANATGNAIRMHGGGVSSCGAVGPGGIGVGAGVDLTGAVAFLGSGVTVQGNNGWGWLLRKANRKAMVVGSYMEANSAGEILVGNEGPCYDVSFDGCFVRSDGIVVKNCQGWRIN